MVKIGQNGENRSKWWKWVRMVKWVKMVSTVSTMIMLSSKDVANGNSLDQFMQTKPLHVCHCLTLTLTLVVLSSIIK